MLQSAEKILDHNELFSQSQYKELFDRKKSFECAAGAREVTKVAEWTKTMEYREKNFAREALVVNPAKACQPLGSTFCAAGFEGTLAYVHGSQGCAAYFRSHLSRHFKEPSSIVSDSMTEDAAVFGGLNNMIEGLRNAYALYKPKMIAVSTSCMAEVIGDDLGAFIGNARNDGSIPADFPVPFAHTPSFVGSHIVGYDNMLKGILGCFWRGNADDTEMERCPNDTINLIGGFDPYCVGNLRELKRIAGLFGVEHIVLSDPSDVYDTPTDGHFRMYDGGTTIEQVKAALHSKATLSMQEFSTPTALSYCKERGHETAAFNYPLGVKATDAFIMALARLTGRAVPAELEKERGRLLDAMADSMYYLHGKRFAVYGDPDMTIGLVGFLLEMGAEPVHILSTNGSKKWAKRVQALLDAYPQGKDCKTYPGCDLWHMRSLLFTEPVDFLIGNTYGKALEKDTRTPLIRLGFPIFDRHHHHRFALWGYQGGLNVLVRILDRVFDELDRKAMETGISFDAIR
jgi:nitrogenase molybdenum-iron protein beta chain